MKTISWLLGLALACAGAAEGQSGAQAAASAPGSSQAPAVAAADTQDVSRLVAGFEKAAAVSAHPVQKIFVDFYFDRALSASGRVRAWGDLRLESLPQSIGATALTAPFDIGKAVATTPLDQLVQSGEFLAGAEYRITNQTRRAVVSLTGAYGAAAPLDGDPSRQNFYREYYGGIRIAGGAGAGHQLDLGIGQNEAVTEGRLHGTVLRFDTFYALPAPGTGFIYLFGTAMVKASGSGASRDLYRVGLGIDLVEMLRSIGSH